MIFPKRILEREGRGAYSLTTIFLAPGRLEPCRNVAKMLTLTLTYNCVLLEVSNHDPEDNNFREAKNT